MPATTGDVPAEIAAIGTVEAISTVEVKSRVTGQIAKVLFREGEDVRQGSVLFELDQQPFLQQINEIEANLARDTANEKQARANIARDQATLKNAQSVAERGAQLAKEGIMSRQQSDEVNSTAGAARASLEADEAALESAQAAVKADRARLAQARLQLSYTKISAPISGRAGAISLKEGTLAKENDTTLVTLLQVSPVYVTFSVPENVLSEVRKSYAGHTLPVSATTADGVSTSGTLRFIDSAVDSSTGTIKLKASFENGKRALWPGQFVNVSARLSLEQGRILVPSRTVQTGPRGKYVWVLKNDQTVTMRDVQVLRNYQPARSEEQAVIGAGLSAGEKIVSEGQMRLLPGARVRILAQPGPTISSNSRESGS